MDKKELVKFAAALTPVVNVEQQLNNFKSRSARATKQLEALL